MSDGEHPFGVKSGSTSSGRYCQTNDDDDEEMQHHPMLRDIPSFGNTHNSPAVLSHSTHSASSPSNPSGQSGVSEPLVPVMTGDLAEMTSSKGSYGSPVLGVSQTNSRTNSRSASPRGRSGSPVPRLRRRGTVNASIRKNLRRVASIAAENSGTIQAPGSGSYSPQQLPGSGQNLNVSTMSPQELEVGRGMNQNDATALFHPFWLCFYDQEVEQSYRTWFYVDTHFYGGKMWSLLVVGLDIWFMTYYHDGFNFKDLGGWFSSIPSDYRWAPMAFHILISAALGICLFVKRLHRFREEVFLLSLASHWPAVTIAILYGKHPHSFIYYYIILCYFFCAFIAQARFCRVVFLLAMVPAIMLFLSTFPFSYWDDKRHSRLEMGWWCFVVPPMLLLRHFESLSRTAFVTVQQAAHKIQSLREKMESTHELLAKLFPETASRLLLRSDGMIPIVQHRNAVMVVTDITGFTRWTASTDPSVVIMFLSVLFTRIDKIAHGNLEKISTVGDSFFGCAFSEQKTSKRFNKFSIPPFARRCVQVIRFALKLQSIGTIPLPQLNIVVPLKMRIGVHCGDVIGSFVGRAPLKYDLFGDEVDKAKLMEMRGQSPYVHISSEVADEIQAYANFQTHDQTWEDEEEKVPLGLYVSSVVALKNDDQDLTGSFSQTSETNSERSKDESTNSSKQQFDFEDRETMVSVSRALCDMAVGGMKGNKLIRQKVVVVSEVDVYANEAGEVKEDEEGDKDSNGGDDEEKEKDPRSMNIVFLTFHGKTVERAFAFFRDRTSIPQYVAWFFLTLSGMNYCLQILILCMDTGNVANRFLSLAMLLISVGYGVYIYRFFDSRRIPLRRHAPVVGGNASLNASRSGTFNLGSVNWQSGTYNSLRRQQSSTAFATGSGSGTHGSGTLGSQESRSFSGESPGSPRSAVVSITAPAAAEKESTPTTLTLPTVIYFNLIAIVSSFLEAGTDCNGIDNTFYTGQLIAIYYLIALLSCQFLIHVVFPRRIALNCLTAALAYIVTLIRRAIYQDEVMTFEISYGLGMFATCCQSYFTEFSLRTVFLLKDELNDMKDKQLSLISKALKIMLPGFVIEKQAELGQFMGAVAEDTDDEDEDFDDFEDSLENSVTSMNSTQTYQSNASNASELSTRQQGATSAIGGILTTPPTPATTPKAVSHQKAAAYSVQSTAISVKSDAPSSNSKQSDSKHSSNSDDRKKRNALIEKLRNSQKNMLWEYPNAIIVFMNFVMPDERDVHLADETIRHVELILQENHMLKIKTVGTTILAAGSLDTEASVLRTQASDQQMVDVMTALREVRRKVLSARWDHYTIGVHAGPCFGAVMGTNNLCFDVFGDTVNTASRMQTTAEDKTIRMSSSIADILIDADVMDVEKVPEQVAIKGKGNMTVYQLGH